jgi:Uma2 family endonuclease
MATAAALTQEKAKWPTPPPARLRRFTVAEFHRLAEAGILAPGERIELINGWLVSKVTHNPPHDSTVSIIRRRLDARLPGGWIVRIQSSITLSKDSEPEPDLAVVHGPEERYLKVHPRPRQIGLLVEVADASLAQDQTSKLEIYARDRIPIYWIVNLVDDRIEVYTQPRTGRSPTYRQRVDYLPGQDIPFVLAGAQVDLIPVRDLLPDFAGLP